MKSFWRNYCDMIWHLLWSCENAHVYSCTSFKLSMILLSVQIKMDLCTADELEGYAVVWVSSFTMRVTPGGLSPGHMSKRTYIWNFTWKRQTVFLKYTNLQFRQQCVRVPIVPHVWKYMVFSDLHIYLYLFHWVSAIFLITNELKHLSYVY